MKQGLGAALPHLRQYGGALTDVGTEVDELDQAPVVIRRVQPTAVSTPYAQHARNYMDEEPKLPNATQRRLA